MQLTDSDGSRSFLSRCAATAAAAELRDDEGDRRVAAAADDWRCFTGDGDRCLPLNNPDSSPARDDPADAEAPPSAEAVPSDEVDS